MNHKDKEAQRGTKNLYFVLSSRPKGGIYLLHDHIGAGFLNYEANTKDFSFAVCFAPLRSLREMYYHDCLDTYVDVISMLPVFLGSSFFAIFISLVFFCTAIAAKMLSVNDMA